METWFTPLRGARKPINSWETKITPRFGIQEATEMSCKKLNLLVYDLTLHCSARLDKEARMWLIQSEKRIKILNQMSHENLKDDSFSYIK